MTLKELCETSFNDAQAAGWNSKPRSKGTDLMLIVSEIAEAMEGARKDLMDDKLPSRKMEEVELADALIRIGHYCGKWGYTDMLVENLHMPCFNGYLETLDPTTEKGAHLMAIVSKIAWINAVEQRASETVFYRANAIKGAVRAIVSYAATYDLDLDGAIEEKLAYNRVREDHKPEHREAEGGKKW